MKKFHCPFVELFLFLSVLFFATTVLAAPKLVIQQKLFDFGTVEEGTTVSHAFEISNQGDEDLNIQRVLTSCGCVTSTKEAEFVAPGQSTQVKVDFATAGYSGSKLKSLRVFTNDPLNKVVLLSLKGNIETQMLVEPEYLVFNNISLSELSKVSKKVEVSLKPGSNFNLGDVTTSGRLKILSISGDAKKKIIEVGLSDNLPVGEIRERILVPFSESDNGISIPVLIRVANNIKITPPLISFGLLSGKESVFRNVVLENFSDKPIKLLSSKTSDPLLQVRVKELMAGRKFKVETSLAPSFSGERFTGQILLEFDHPDYANVVVNCHGIKIPQGKN